ncbi:hypothetical protein ACOMHN_051113 [Nucella lapillus]
MGVSLGAHFARLMDAGLVFQRLRYGFGDCRRTLYESAVLVEEIVHQQMGSLLVQASDIAVQRGSRFVGLEEMLFLLRKDKVKLRRLLRYLELKDLKVATLKGVALDEEDSMEMGDVKPQIMKRRRRMCYDFLASIDNTGELLSLFDDQGEDNIKHERLVRAELMSRNLDPQQYKEFCEARQANFSRRYKSQRFKDWLMTGVYVDIKPNPQGLEVISYLAYETVAQIVDLSLLVKQDRRAIVSHPEKRILAPVQYNYHDLHAASLMAAQAKAAAAGAGTSPPIKVEGFQSPPNTPTPGLGNSQNASSSSLSSSSASITMAAITTASATTANMAATITAAINASATNSNTIAPSTPTSVGVTQAGTVSLTSPALGSAAAAAAAARINKKKRKKSGPATTLDMSLDSAITPGDIREAMRRYFEDLGPFASSIKVRNPSIARTRLLCA